ncbi:MAG: hypothetical protein AAGI52_10935 [Bacteroidota bacterium]
MRLSPLLLVLALVSCDVFGSSAPDVVGTWQGVDATAAWLVTSQTDQSVPDFSRPAREGLRISGAEEASLRYVGCRSDPRSFVFSEGSIESFCRPEGLALVASPWGSAPWTFALVGETRTYRVELQDANSVRLMPEGYSFQRTTLRDTVSGAEVTLQGHARFEQTDFRMGQPAPVVIPLQWIGWVETEAGFDADGGFWLAARNASGGSFRVQGVWRHVSGNRLEIDFGQWVVTGFPGLPIPTARTAWAEVRDGRLAFFLADQPGEGDDPETLARSEGRLHAMPGSFESVLEGSLYDLGRVSE